MVLFSFPSPQGKSPFKGKGGKKGRLEAGLPTSEEAASINPFSSPPTF